MAFEIIDPIPNDQDMPDDEYFYWGILRGAGDMMKRKSHTYYFCDHSYFLPGHNNKTNWYRITKNAHTNSCITEQTPDRYEKYFAQDLAPWQTTGTQIIVCPPTGAIEWFFDAQQWLNGVLDTLKQQTSREIVVRDKPMNPQVKTVNGLTQLSGFDKHKSQKPLEEDLKNVKSFCILIGPEGDFSPVERELILQNIAVKPFTLSRNILRSDTAAISAI